MAKISKKRGCLYAFLIGCAVFIALTIFLIFTVKNMLQVFDLSVKEFEEYVNMLNREVVESELATDPVSNQDFQTFKNKAIASQFNIMDEHDNVNLNLVTIPIGSDITLTGYEVGAMLNSGFANSENYDTIKILQFSIIQTDFYQIKTVLKFDLTKIKNAVGQLASNLPNSLYITCESVAVASTPQNPTSRLILTNSKFKINKLSDEENEKIVNLLNKMTGEMDENLQFENMSDQIISEALTKVAQAANCDLYLSNGSLTLKKITA